MITSRENVWGQTRSVGRADLGSIIPGIAVRRRPFVGGTNSDGSGSDYYEQDDYLDRTGVAKKIITSGTQRRMPRRGISRRASYTVRLNDGVLAASVFGGLLFP